MEVHPPEHGIHTWRDFYVHMGTICLGLLIAIGLEQSVEALHHHHELVKLRESMREDAEKNIREATELNEDEMGLIRWLDARMAQVHTALDQRTTLAAPPPEPPNNQDDDYPADPSWLAAKTSGILSFMPENEIKGYSEASKWIGNIEPEMLDWSRVYRKRIGFEARFCGQTCTDSSFAAASPAELREYLSLLQEERESIRWDIVSIHAVYGSESAILAGEHDLKKIQKAERTTMSGDH